MPLNPFVLIKKVSSKFVVFGLFQVKVEESLGAIPVENSIESPLDNTPPSHELWIAPIKNFTFSILLLDLFITLKVTEWAQDESEQLYVKVNNNRALT